MLTTDQILDVVNGLGKAGTKGRTEALRRANRDAMRRSSLTPAHREFLDAADQVPANDPVRYTHPAATAPMLTARSRGDQPLSPSELAWLNRLPTDPTQVPFTDAQRLLSLEAAVTQPDDRTLLRSIAAPVREYHDTRQAEADLATASAPIPAAPHQTLAALADTIAADNDYLEPDEVVGRAANLLQQNGEQRQRQQSLAVAQAQRILDAVKAAAADRAAVTR